MDIADVSQFDKAGPLGASSAGIIIHETVEQYEKAKMGISKGSVGVITVDSAGIIHTPDMAAAHAVALKAEDRVNGNTRVTSSNPNIDEFIEKNGNHSRQAYAQPPGSGTVNVIKM